MADQDQYDPREFAAAVRSLYPDVFRKYNDQELLRAIKATQPQIYQRFVHSGLEGLQYTTPGSADLPQPPRLPATAPIPERKPDLQDTLLSVGSRSIPSLLGAGAGALLLRNPAVGAAIGGALGGGSGELAGQKIEQATGQREMVTPEGAVVDRPVNLPVVGVEAALGALPLARGATLGRRIGGAAVQGGLSNVVSVQGRAALEEGRAATPTEMVTAGGLGAVLGAGVQTGMEGVGALARVPGQRRAAAVEADNARRAADWRARIDREALAQAAAVTRRAEEAAAQQQAARAAELVARWGPDAAGGQGTLKDALAKKVYLEELADMGVSAAEIGTLRGSMERILGRLNEPEWPVSPLPPRPTPRPLPPTQQLPARSTRQGVDVPAIPGDPILAYPPGARVEPLAVGAERRIIGGQRTGDPPPLERVASALQASLEEPADLAPRLVLQPEPATTAPPPSQPTLFSGRQLRPDFASPLEQVPTLGGAPRTREEPWLPGADQPAPLDGRQYATGPNAGPRRKGEAHGRPRRYRRRVQVGDKVRFELAPSRLAAEDPGTYPEQVRRELATMVWELENFPVERVQGGVTAAQMEGAGKVGRGGSVSEGIGEARAAGATAGGSIPGTHLYWEIREAAQGSFPSHTKREAMIAHIRAALLEGKGNGLTDAAAQVARGRLRQRAAEAAGVELPMRRIGRGFTAADRKPAMIRGDHEIRSRGDEGDELIRWVDPNRKRSDYLSDLSPWQRTLRETDDGEILRLGRLAREVDPEDPSYPLLQQAREEAVRRGLVDPEQPGLRMEGPGGAGGPRLFDFEGGPAQPRTEEPTAPPPGRPADAPPPSPPPAAESQPALPGAEGVRAQEIPTPPVTEAPFALTPPPERPTPAAQQKGMTDRRQRSIWEALKGEEGVLIMQVPAGDREGLRKWLRKHEGEYGTARWYTDIEEAIDNGEWDRAWEIAAGESARSYARALEAAGRNRQAAVERSVRGTPLQDDLNTQIVAQQRAQRDIGREAPEVPDFPPTHTVTQAGAARGRATLGPAGILNPGRPQRPLRPQDRAHTLPRTAVETILEETEKLLEDHPELITVIPGNRDSALRVFRQVAELAHLGKNTSELKQYLKMTNEELAQHDLEAVSEAGRLLQAYSAFVQRNRDVLTEAAQGMSMGGALRGMLKGGEGQQLYGARGRPLGTVGKDLDPQATVAALLDGTLSFNKAMVVNTLQRPKKASELELLQAASYPFMLMRWRTAVRNAMSQFGRYGVDALDEALSAPLERLFGNPEAGALRAATAREMFTAGGKGGALVTPRTSWKLTLQGIYDFTAASLEQLSPRDARRTLALLDKAPAHLSNFLGAMSQLEANVTGRSRFKILNSMLNPQFQAVMTTFNRAAEFSGRGMVFDATVRARLRAKGLDPDTVLQLPFEQLTERVGGSRALDDLLYAATGAALEATFAGVAAKDSIPGAILSFVNKAWPLKLGYPFPKFNLVAAPRWIYDHSPAALMELIRFPLDTAGLTSGTYAGGRLYRGVRARNLQQQMLPELAGKKQLAMEGYGEAKRRRIELGRELGSVRRLVTRLERKAQQGLPGMQTELGQARQRQASLEGHIQRVTEQQQEAFRRIRDIESQEKTFQSVIEDAVGINAPTPAQYLARMTTGMGLLYAAGIIRSQKGAEGTRWYEFRDDRVPEGQDPDILDFRPYAPFAQYLFVADVLNDMEQWTNWEAARAEQEETGDWTGAIWNHYEGKYTREELQAEFAKAFLSISRAGGTTKTLTDLLTQNGWPSLQDVGDSLIGTIGQFLARYTIPLQEPKALLAGFSEEEAKVRVTPRATLEEPYRPLADPLANVPGISRVIPDRISQTTGQPVATSHPWLALFAGVGSTKRDFVVEEVRRVGVPGSSVYLKETGDYGVDRYMAESYARKLQQELPKFIETEHYQALGTPARQRDYLQARVFPLLKRLVVLETQADLGRERYTAATVKGEAARRAARRGRMLESMAAGIPEVPPLPGTPTPEEDLLRSEVEELQEEILGLQETLDQRDRELGALQEVPGMF